MGNRLLGTLFLGLLLISCTDTTNTYPAAELVAPDSARVNVPVVFDASGSSDAETDIREYRFDFGDGAEVVSGVARAEHTYANPGTYEVHLTVYDQDNLQGHTKLQLPVIANQLPVAMFDGPILARIGQEVVFDGSASRDDDGEIVSYAWDYGDETELGANAIAKHTYLEEGIYDVTLTVTDNDEETSTISRAIDVRTAASLTAEPPVALLSVPSTADAGQMLTFDASASRAPGATASYRVYFGDGNNATGRSVNHAYTNAGNYTALLMLTATYADGSTNVSIDARQVSVTAQNDANPAPTAAVSAPASTRFGQTIVFDGSQSQTPGAMSATYDWDFGDGTSGSGKLASHAYAVAGVYIPRLTLTVTYSDGTQNISEKNVVVTVFPNAAPVAKLSGDTRGAAGSSLSFDAFGSVDADGFIVSTVIDFGDGALTTAPSASHVYASAGTYTVRATVTDNDGATDSEILVVTIDAVSDTVDQPVAVIDGPLSLTATKNGAFSAFGSAAPGASSVAYSWDFGDFTPLSSLESATHSYTMAGIYIVTLTVTATYSDGTQNVDMATRQVEVVSGADANAAPVASISAPVSGRFGDTLVFDGSGSIAPGASSVAYEWDYADGSPLDNGSTTTHPFALAGVYSVTLTVTATYADGTQNISTAVHPVEIVGNADPVAKLVGDGEGLVTQPLGFDASASADADGSIASTVIDFGDGNSTTSAVATHSYAAAGLYTVMLTVTDNDGATATSSIDVTISPYNTSVDRPIAALSGATSLLVDQTGVFDATGTVAPDASSVVYTIDFGDGSPVALADRASHAFAGAGNYIVRVKAVATYPDASTAYSTAVVPVSVKSGNTVYAAPEAVISAPSTIRFSDTANFDASASVAEGASSKIYKWTFGDGATALGVSASHEYAVGGYPVTLLVTATYADGTTATAVANRNVTVNPNAAPVAKLTGDTTGLATDILSFDASGSTDVDGTVASYSIDFGDGSPAVSEATASHPYAMTGVYTVTATVTDNDGATHSAQILVTVESWSDAVAAPVAALSGPTQLMVGELGTFATVGSSASGATGTTYSLNLGDTTTKTGQTVNHSYGAAGSYVATLTLTAFYPDGTQNVATATHPIEVISGSDYYAAPSLAISGPSSSRFDRLVDFSSAVNASGAQSVSIDWTLSGPGTYLSTGSKHQQTFASGDVGSWTISAVATITYADGSSEWVSDSIPFTVGGNGAPVARLSGDSSGLASQTLSFDASASTDADGSIVSYSIDFGDGSPVATQSVASHKYAAAGPYMVTLTVTDNDGATASDARMVTIDTYAESVDAPIAVLNGPSNLVVGESGAFSASGSSAPGASSVEYRIHFGDGSFADANAAAHSYASAGNFVVTLALTANYADGTTNFTTAVLPVNVKTEADANAAPVADFSMPSSVRFDVPVLVDANSTTAPGAASVSYAWDWGDTTTGSGVTATKAYGSTSGTFAVTLTVTATYDDGSVATSQKTKTVSLVENVKPAAQLNVPVEATVDDTIFYDAGSSSDSDGSIVSYSIDFGDGSPVSASANGTHVYTADGTYTISLVVTDNDGATDSISRSIRVFTTQESGRSPTARFISPAVADANELVTFDASESTSGSGDIAEFFWDLGDGRSFSGASFINTSYPAGGTWYITLRVTNTDGLSNAVTREIWIRNHLPTFTSASLNPGPHFEDSLLMVSTAGWYDHDGDPAGYRYQWFVNGSEVPNENTYKLDGTFFSKGDTVATYVTANDGMNDGNALWTNATVIQNTAPAITRVDLSPSVVREADTLTAVPQGWSDIDGDPETAYQYLWYVNDVSQPAITGGSITGAAFDRGDEVYAVVWPDDLDTGGVGDPVTSSTMIIENTAPVISSATISGAPFDENATLGVTIAASDIDGDAITYLYQWQRWDGASFFNLAGATNPNLGPEWFDEDDQIRAVLQPRDDADFGAAFTTPAVVIGNTAPVMTSVELSPADPLEGSTIVANPSSYDADNTDSVTYLYEWYVDGVLQASITGDNIDGASFDKGQTVATLVTANDGQNLSAPMWSAALTIGNTPPTLASLSVTGPVSTLTNVVAYPGAITDVDAADGVSLSLAYEWYVNGVLYSGATTEVLDASAFAKGDTLWAAAKPFDGDDEGQAVWSNAVTVENTVPSFSSVDIGTGYGIGDDVIADALGYSDADMDPLANTDFVLWVNGMFDVFSSSSIASATLSGGSFAKGDTVAVSARPCDIEACGVWVLSNIETVLNTAPIATSVTFSVSGPEVTELTTVTAWPNGNDIDGDTFNWTYQWYVNGTPSVASATIDGSSFNRGDEIWVAVTPNDGDMDGIGDPLESAHLWVENSHPVIASATVTPEPYYESNSLGVTISSYDLDGDLIDYTYQWQTWNGASFVNIVGEQTAVLGTDKFAAEDVIRVVVTPLDHEDVGAPYATTGVTIWYDAPVMTSAAISPTDPQEADTITASATSTFDGPDSVSYSYEWYVDGVSIPSVTGNSITGTHYDKGQTVATLATPYVGPNSGAPMWSNTITAQNTAPTMTSVNGVETGASVATHISASDAYHTCAITAAGGVRCWGYNSSGQLGNGSNINSETPVEVIGLTSGVVSVEVGPSHSCALTDAGGVKCWGANGNGELGDATNNPSWTPVDVSGLTSGVKQISLGSGFSCAVTTGNGAKCWGRNTNGNLGDDSTNPSNVPVDVVGLTSGVDHISTGHEQACAVTIGGGAKCWGSNGAGRLGDGTNIERHTPVDVFGLSTGVDRIESGVFQACAVMDDQTARCWGYNGFGNLGDGTQTESFTPVTVSVVSGPVASIGPDFAYTCAMLTSGQVECWGDNGAGKLGDGTNTASYTSAVTVAGVSDAIQLAVGHDHACVRQPDDSVSCWGRNAEGQIGNGSFTDQWTPVSVNGLEASVTVAKLSDDPVYETSSLEVTADATDIDPADLPIDPARFAHYWHVNGVTVTAVTGNMLDGTHFNKGDEVDVAVTYTDFENAESFPLYASTVTIQNTAPTLDAATIASIGDPEYGTESTIYVDGWIGLADVDPADTPVLTYQWYVNGLPVAGETGSVLLGVSFSEGDSVFAQVTPFDGDDYGLSVNTPSATIINTPPTIDTADIGTGPYYVNDTITVSSLGAADADAGDTVTVEYLWFINGTAGSTASSINSGFAKGNTVTAGARAFDGDAYSNWVYASVVTIQNTAPVANTVTLSPSPAYTNDTISYTATSSDADGDAVSYAKLWFVNGASTGVTAETLASSNFVAGNAVTLELTPFDGEDYGATITSAALTIQNTPPTQAGITFYPSPYAVGDSLYVSVTTASTDIDGDTVTYNYDWSKNGTAFASGSTAVAANLLTGTGETWTVVVTPNDGSANGTTTYSVKTLPQDWYVMGGSPLSGREQASTVWTGSEVIIWGGWNSASAMNDGARYNPATDTWVVMSAGVLGARHAHKAVWTGAEMIVWGGTTDGSVSYADGERYDPTIDDWSGLLPSSGLSARYEHSAVWTGKEMVVWSGFGGGNDGHRYNPTTNQWNTTPMATGPAARQRHATVWTGKEMIVWGGYNGSPLNDGARYDPTANTWAALPAVPAGVGGGYETAGVWTGSEMVVWGGDVNGTPQNTGARYNPANNTWTALPASGLAGRQQHAMVWTGEEVIVWGGLGSGTTLYKDGRRYDPATNKWSMMSFPGISARRMVSAVWTGNEMAVWGGTGSSGALADGSRYRPYPAVDDWTLATLNGAPAGRRNHTAVWTGSEMIIWGGHNFADTQRMNTGSRYDPATDTWVPTATAPITGRFVHASVWTGKEMIIWGGYDTFSTRQSDGARYDPRTDSWQLTAAIPLGVDGRQQPYAVWTGREMLIWGGLSPTNVWRNDGARYYPQTNTWATISSAPFASRGGMVSAWTGKMMLVWGGYNGGYPNTGARYFPAAGTWDTMSTLGVSGREYAAVAWTGSEMLVFGGKPNVGNGSNTLFRYDADTDTWASGANAPVTARFFASGVWTGREFIVWGGENMAPTFFDDGAAFDPRAGTWTSIDSIGLSPRFEHSAVWTGQEMIVWGGRNGATHFNDGTRYTPPATTETWIETDTTDPDLPLARMSHSTVWTGKEVIVWGGQTSVGETSTGGRYDPVTDSWLPTNTVGAPAARGSHAGVWSGRRMLIWGGNPVKTGGRYDPATNSWTAMSTTNEPGSGFRDMFPFVWTGRELIVWGGRDSTNYPTDGGLYDPATNTWTVMNTTGAPAGRHHARAVWTGREMIVWGGHSSGVHSSAPYVFDPSNGTGGTWTTKSSTGAPAGRSYPSLVWTGKEMLVWGGAGVVPYADGGRYDPAADQWSPMAASPLSARWHQVFTWTGREMLIWGGYDGSSTNDGAAYDPRSNAWRSLVTSSLSARYFEFNSIMSSVWTGREWFIWGGYSELTNSRYNTGARFIPGASDEFGFVDDMESGANGWTSVATNGGQNLWAQISEPACTPASSSSSTSWYFGVSAQCSFDAGNRVSGRLMSPEIASLPSNAVVSFNYRRQGECTPPCTYDNSYVQVSTDGGTSFSTLVQLTDNSGTWLSSGEISLAAYAGQNVIIGFEFDSVDSIANTSIGWMIDDVEVTVP